MNAHTRAEALRLLDALRERIEKAPVAILKDGSIGGGYVKAYLSSNTTGEVPIGKRVALVVLDDKAQG